MLTPVSPLFLEFLFFLIRQTTEFLLEIWITMMVSETSFEAEIAK